MSHSPPAGATPVCEATRVQLDTGEKAQIEFTPEQSGTTFKAPIVAVTRANGTTYEIHADGTGRYDESPVPPSEPNHLSQCFIPSLEFEDSLTVTIRNVGDQIRTYTAQVVGWEE